jgi:hypothetical protein
MSIAPAPVPTRRFMLTTSAGLLAGAAIGSAAGAAVGSGAPALAAATTQGALTYLTPTGDTSGADDYAAIAAGLTGGTAVVLLPGTFYINQTLTIPGDCSLFGCGPATGLVPAATGFTGSAMIEFAANSYNFMVKDLAITGPSGTTSSNPAVDVFSPGAGANRWWIEDIDVNFCNGWVLNPDFTGPMAGVVQGVVGSNNAGGIRIVGADTTGSTGQVAISDVNLQLCESSEALLLENVDDIAVQNFNASCASSPGTPVAVVSGGCQNVLLTALDIGFSPAPSNTTQPVLLIESVSGGGSPTEVQVTASTFVFGGIGVQVTGGASRIRFHGCTVLYSEGDGWQFTGTGTAVMMDGCSASTNNKSGGTAYDVHVTSTAHVGIFQMAYCSSGVTDALDLASSGNHVSNVNPTYPGGKSVSGTANGW